LHGFTRGVGSQLARTIQTEHHRVGQLVLALVLTDALAQLLRVAGHIEDVVGNLERHTQPMTVLAQAGDLCVRRFADRAPDNTACVHQTRCLALVDSRDGLCCAVGIARGLLCDIHGLASTQPARACRIRERSDASYGSFRAHSLLAELRCQ